MKTTKELIEDSNNKKDFKKLLGTELKNIRDLPGSEKLKTSYKRQLFKEIIQDEYFPKLIEKEINTREHDIKYEFISFLAKNSFDEAMSFRKKNSGILTRGNKDVFDYIKSSPLDYLKFTHNDRLSIKKVFNFSDQDFQIGIEKICYNMKSRHDILILVKQFDFLKNSPKIISKIKEAIINGLSSSAYFFSADEIKDGNDVMDFSAFLRSNEVQEVVKKTHCLKLESGYCNYGCLNVNGCYDAKMLDLYFGLGKSFLENVRTQEAYKKLILYNLSECINVELVYTLLRDSSLGDRFLKTQEAIDAINKGIDTFKRTYYIIRSSNYIVDAFNQSEDLRKSYNILLKMLI